MLQEITSRQPAVAGNAFAKTIIVSTKMEKAVQILVDYNFKTMVLGTIGNGRLVGGRLKLRPNVKIDWLFYSIFSKNDDKAIS